MPASDTNVNLLSKADFELRRFIASESEPANPTIGDWAAGTFGMALAMVEGGLPFSSGIPVMQVILGLLVGALAILIFRQVRYSRALYLPEWSVVFFSTVFAVFRFPTADTINHELHQAISSNFLPPEEHFDFWRWNIARVEFLAAGVLGYSCVALRAPKLQWFSTLLGFLALLLLGLVARVFTNHFWIDFHGGLTNAGPFVVGLLAQLQDVSRYTPTFLPATFFSLAAFYPTSKLARNPLPAIWTFRLGQICVAVLCILLSIVFAITVANLVPGEFLPFTIVRSVWFCMMVAMSICVIRLVTSDNKNR